MIIYTPDGLRKAVDYFLAKDAFAFDVETLAARPEDRGNPRLNRVSWLAMSTDGLTVSVPLGFPNGEFLREEYPLLKSGLERQAAGKPLRESDYSKDKRKATKIFSAPPEHLRFTPEVADILRPLFFSDRLKVGHNLKYDLESIAKHFGGEIPPPPYADTMIAAFILDVRHKGWLGLDDCVKRELEYPMQKGVGANIALHSFIDVAKYAFIDGRMDWLLWKEYEARIARYGMKNLFRLEMDVLEVVVHMEQTGVLIDQDILKILDGEFRSALEKVQAEVWRHGGRVFNIGSNQELQQILFTPKKDGGCGLKPTRLTKGGKDKKKRGEPLTLKDYAVDEKSLEGFLGKHPIIEPLLRYNDLDKLISAFIVPYIGGEVVRTTNGKSKVEIRETSLVNGRIHGKFNQIGTDTGRFSSSEPNLQQVPSRTEEGKKIRSAFIKDPGEKLIVADYSQIEPRLIADLSGDKRLVQTFLDGEDIYTALAMPFGLDRQAGKLLVLAVSYGVGPDKIALSLGLKLQEAKDLIYEEFPRAYPLLDKLKTRTIVEAKRRKPVYVQTLLGRRRYLPELWSSDNYLRGRAERQAFNTLIQGSAADINKVGLVRAFRMVTPLGAMPILTVHDEVVVRAPEEKAEEVSHLVREALEGVSLLKVVPLVADVKVVDNWSEGK